MFIEYQTNKYGCGVIGKVVRVTADEKVMEGNKVNISLVNAIASIRIHMAIIKLPKESERCLKTD